LRSSRTTQTRKETSAQSLKQRHPLFTISAVLQHDINKYAETKGQASSSSPKERNAQIKFIRKKEKRK
jgi:hypothetical protein